MGNSSAAARIIAEHLLASAETCALASMPDCMCRLTAVATVGGPNVPPNYLSVWFAGVRPMRRDVRAGQAVKRWTFGVSFVMSGYPHIGREAHLTDVPASALDPVVDYVGLFDQGVRAGVSTLTPSVFPAARLQSASPIPPGGDRIGFTYEITTGPPRLP